jgi:O-antigen biosynthesis protein
MPLKIIQVLIYGINTPIQLETFHSNHNFDVQYSGIDVIIRDSDNNFLEDLYSLEPDIILVIGTENDFPIIKEKINHCTKKVLYIPKSDWETTNKEKIAETVFQKYIENSIYNYKTDDQISVYTVTCNTKEKIKIAYQSLLNQSHQNWEWVIYDDSTDQQTWQIVKQIAKEDSRIKINKNNNGSKYSKIGFNKFNAAANCSSEYIIELDHDDAFYRTTLEHILIAHKKFPKSGFIYGDWVEINFETKQEFNYDVNNFGGGFAWEYGYYYEIDSEFHNRKMKVCSAPNINSLTLRRMWSLCNHPKSWKKDLYMQIGGHNKNLNCADDYELIIRTFLNTEMVHLKNFCYYQYFYNDDSKATNHSIGKPKWVYSGDIIRTVKYIEKFYRQQIKKRIEQLGKIDWFNDCFNNSFHRLLNEGSIFYRENENKLNIDFKI